MKQIDGPLFENYVVSNSFLIFPDHFQRASLIGKTRLIDHLSPVWSELSVFIRDSKSLIIDIEILTFRIRVLTHFRILQ
jgi:hypothetical protein